MGLIRDAILKPGELHVVEGEPPPVARPGHRIEPGVGDFLGPRPEAGRFLDAKEEVGRSTPRCFENRRRVYAPSEQRPGRTVWVRRGVGSRLRTARP